MDVDRTEEIELLRQLVKWTREAALPVVRQKVEASLDSESKKRVYQAIADGTVSVRGLENVAGVSRATAQSLVTDWEAAGLVEPGVTPPKALFTLAELGIALPESKAKAPGSR